MGAQSRLFTSLASGSGKATAVMACAVVLLVGCGGSGGGASEASTPAIRGDVAATSSLTVTGAPTTAAVGTTIALTSAGGAGTAAVSYATTSTGCAITDSSLTATAAGTCSVIATNGTQTGTATFTFTDAVAQVAKPGFATFTKIVVSDGMATFTVAPGTSGGTPTSYVVRVLPAPGQTGNSGTCTVTGTRGSCDVTGLTNGSLYTTNAIASNAAGSGFPSKDAAFTPAAGPGAPATPAISTQVAGAGSVRVSVVSGTGGGTPESYTVRAYSLMSSMPARTCTVTVAPGFCDLTGLTKGSRYTVKASATNAAGTSFESRPVTVVAG